MPIMKNAGSEEKVKVQNHEKKMKVKSENEVLMLNFVAATYKLILSQYGDKNRRTLHVDFDRKISGTLRVACLYDVVTSVGTGNVSDVEHSFVLQEVQYVDIAAQTRSKFQLKKLRYKSIYIHLYS